MSRQSPSPPPPDDPWAGFLSFDEESEGQDEEPAPAPPPPSPISLEKPRAAPKSAKILGKPPKDPMSAAAWGFSLAMELAHEAVHDDDLTPSQRRREVLKCIAGAKGLMSDAFRVDIGNKIDDHRRQLESKKRGKAVAKTEPRAAAPAGAKVIPIRREDRDG